MAFQNQEAVGTPDHGDGIVWGVNQKTGKVIVRVNVQVTVPPGEKSKTFNGWQYEYFSEELSPASNKRKARR